MPGHICWLSPAVAVWNMLGCCRTAVVPDRCGSFPRMGDLVVMSRGFVGVYRGFAVSAVFSRRRFQGRFSRTADFQRSRWDNIRKAAGFPRTPTPDTGEQARTGKSRQFSHIIHTPPPQSQSPPASTDTDNSPNVGRRFCRHRQPSQRQQTLLPRHRQPAQRRQTVLMTLTTISTSVDASADSGG